MLSVCFDNLSRGFFFFSFLLTFDFIEKVCTMDYFKSSNLIPIIVGVVLAILVIVILVAYLIGRRRNRNGYQSV
jgi:hypothetical protein